MKVTFIAGDNFCAEPRVELDLPTAPMKGDTIAPPYAFEVNPEPVEAWYDFCEKDPNSDGQEYVVTDRAIGPNGEIVCFVKNVN